MRLVKLLLISILLSLNLASKNYGSFNQLLQLREDTASLYYFHKKGLEYQKVGNYKKALENFKKAYKFTKKIYGINHHYTLQDLNKIAICFYALNRYDDAIKYYLKILKIKKKILDKFNPNLGVTYTNIATVYSEIGKFNLAIEYYKKALKIFITALGKSDYRVSSVYNNLSLLYKDLGKYKKATYYINKALRIDENSNSLKAYVSSTITALFINSEIGNFKQVTKYSKKVINLIDKSNNTYRKADYYNTIGFMYKNQAQYKDALKFYNRAYNLLVKIDRLSSSMGATVLNNLSLVYSDLGDFDKALKFMKKAMPLYKNIYGINSEQTATAYNNLAGIYLDLKEYKNAFKLYKKALSIKKSLFGEYGYNCAISYNNLARYYQEIKNYNSALKYYKIALNIFKKEAFKSSFNIASEEVKIGKNYLLQNRLKKANIHLSNALKVYVDKLGKNSYLNIELYKSLSEVNRKLKNYKTAYSYSKRALDIFLKNRDTLFTILSNKDKKLFIQKEKSIVSLYFKSLLNYKNSKSVNEAYTRWMHIKNSIFNFNSLINQLSNYTNDINLKNKIKELNLLKRELAKIIQNLPDKNSLARERKIKLLKNKIDIISKKIYKKVDKFKIYKELSKSNIATLVNRLKDEDIFIDYAYIDNCYYYFIVIKRDVNIFKIDNINSAKIDKKILLFRDKIKSGNSLLKKSKELYNLIITSNLEKEIDKKSNLIVSLDGILKLFPMEALYKDRYLIEDKSIYYTTNAIEFIKNSLNSFKPKNIAIVFANPNFKAKKIATNRGLNNSFYLSSTFDKLKNSKNEALAIKSTLKPYMQVKLFLENKATEENLFRVKNPKILHLSTHGFFLNSRDILNPMLKSGIVLSGANRSIKNAKDYGILTALKLSGLMLKGTELVVLSACDTALIDTKDTSSLSALFKAFNFAGANRVLLTLWEIKDRETKDFMEQYYKNVTIYKSYSKALKATKLKVIKEHYPPLYWAGFILYGL